jgi:hypothetical protein
LVVNCRKDLGKLYDHYLFQIENVVTIAARSAARIKEETKTCMSWDEVTVLSTTSSTTSGIYCSCSKPDDCSLPIRVLQWAPSSTGDLILL